MERRALPSPDEEEGAGALLQETSEILARGAWPQMLDHPGCAKGGQGGLPREPGFGGATTAGMPSR